MSKRIFLGGGGDENQAKEIDNLYGKTIGNGAKVLYIPIAWSKPEQFNSCLNWFKNAYARFDFEIEMLTDLNDVDYDFLDKFDSIYIGGGNTFALLKIIRETNFSDLLNRFIDSGKAVYGGSAGAIVLGKDISTAFIGNCTDENIVQITDFLGLGVASGYSIKCHYEEEKEAVEEFSMTNNTSVLAISETGGVFIEGDKLTLVGDVEVIKKD
ncbi:MAG: dipeptidase E [Candidatus Paceibacteria bacterium]|jgi:dipeptidase E